jgi:hypothetical protein
MSKEFATQPGTHPQASSSPCENYKTTRGQNIYFIAFIISPPIALSVISLSPVQVDMVDSSLLEPICGSSPAGNGPYYPLVVVGPIILIRSLHNRQSRPSSLLAFSPTAPNVHLSPQTPARQSGSVTRVTAAQCVTHLTNSTAVIQKGELTGTAGLAVFFSSQPFKPIFHIPSARTWPSSLVLGAYIYTWQRRINMQNLATQGRLAQSDATCGMAVTYLSTVGPHIITL